MFRWLIDRATQDTQKGRCPASPYRRLFVDLSTIAQQDAGTGIQRVVRALWRLLDRIELADIVVVPVAATARRGYRVAVRDGDFIVLPEDDAPLVEMGAGDIFFGLDLAAHRLWRHRKQIRRWKRCGGMVAVTVYDLLPLREPAWFPSSTVRNFRRWIRIVHRHADVALCISRHVVDDLTLLLDGRHSLRRRSIRLTLLPLCGNIEGSRPSRGIDERGKAVLSAIEGRPLILMVGTIEPRKGQDVLLDAFDRLPALDCDNDPVLVIVGRPGWRTEALQQRMAAHHRLGLDFHWLDNASDEVLTALYERAALVVVPSRGEGFGLPVIEALAHGRKVLARDLPVFRELDRAGLYYFASDAPDALAHDIMATLRQPDPPRVTLTEDWTASLDALLRALDIAER